MYMFQGKWGQTKDVLFKKFYLKKNFVGKTYFYSE